MDKVQIKEIAEELGVKPKEILEKCAQLGINAKAQTSSVDMKDAEAVMHFCMTGEVPAGYSDKSDKAVKEQPLEQPKEVIKQDIKSTIEQNRQNELQKPKDAPRPSIIEQPKKRDIIIVKKANRQPVQEEAPKQTTMQAVFEPRIQQPSRPAEIKPKPKKPQPNHQFVGKKESGVKISLERDLSDRDEFESYDDVVVLPDLSFQNISIEEDEPVVPKKPTENKNKPNHNRRPQQRGGVAMLAKEDNKKKKYDKPEKEAKVDKIEIPEEVRVYEFAELVNKPLGEVIKKLFGFGMMVTKNDFLDKDAIEILAEEFEVQVSTKNVLEEFDYIRAYDEQDDAYEETRAPIITIMGHVDHGKTSLLDAIRDAKVAHGEAGGITQHIGAYVVNHNGQNITFLDTPGHEAFTHMRARGAQVTDVAIIVVAADDGVMPQTKEAIAHVQDAKTPFIIAINKMDKPSANPDFVKTQLSEMGLTPIEWGGHQEFVNVSARTKEGIDTLLETILIQAELLEIKANPKKKAKAVVVEASLEKGRGPVATILVKDGTLRTADFIVCGGTYGKVRAILDDQGRQIKELGPAMPGQILGLDAVPSAGDTMVSVESEKIAKEFATNIKEHQRQRELSKTTKATFDDLHHLIAEGKLKQLKVILKADVQGSLEAIKASLEKIRNDEVKVHVVLSAVGAITESDIELANAGEGAVVLGFNVKPNATIKDKADTMGVQIKTYSVIFELLDDVKAILGTMLSPITKEEDVGTVEVRQLFSVGKSTIIAGCVVTSGLVTRGAHVRVKRNDKIVYEGRVASLKRFKDDVKEVKNGFECGIVLDDFNELKENDVIHVYKFVHEAATFEVTE